jgi:general secretion pathway protein E
MTKAQQELVRYWSEVASELKKGTPVLKALKVAQVALTRTKLRRAAEAVAEAVSDGATLSAAMAKHGSVFSAHVCALVRAGEAGGVLDVIAERIAKGHEQQTLGPDAHGPEGEHARYWRVLALLLSSGVPILQALDLVADTVGWIELANATRAIRKAVADGQDVYRAMREFPGVFPEPIWAAVAKGESEGELDRQAARIAEALEADDLLSLVTETGEAEAGERPGAEAVNKLLLEAIGRRASDIHLDPTEIGGKVRLRIDGALQEIARPAREEFGRIVNRVKLMSALDVTERRLPQDGRIMVAFAGRQCDFRVSVMPVHLGERIVLRILPRGPANVELSSLGLADDDLATVKRLCHLPNGLVIANGPAGCGKTTMLYSMLHQVDLHKCCVMTVEDPVEYSFEGLGQVQVNARSGLTYARALQHVLRQDPDVIMIGEIRDLQTLEACVQCALTGHLALTTLHTNSGPEAIRRILDVGLEPYRLNASLAAVISQRLVRMLCPDCKKQVEPPLHSVPPEAGELIKGLAEKTFYGPVGCGACGGGYRGRTAIYEILVIDDHIRRAVADGADLARLREAARESGMKTMLADGVEKAARGITSVEEVVRVLPSG